MPAIAGTSKQGRGNVRTARGELQSQFFSHPLKFEVGDEQGVLDGLHRIYTEKGPSVLRSVTGIEADNPHGAGPVVTVLQAEGLGYLHGDVERFALGGPRRAQVSHRAVGSGSQAGGMGLVRHSPARGLGLSLGDALRRLRLARRAWASFASRSAFPGGGACGVFFIRKAAPRR